VVRITMHIAAWASGAFLSVYQCIPHKRTLWSWKVERGLQMAKDSWLLSHAEQRKR